jgi:tetratricopeptide (TPR) repeat protein
MRARKWPWMAGLLALALAGGGFGIWVLLHPASMWVQPWRAERSAVVDGVVFGPYPVEDDFIELKRRGVTTIISLLDPLIPYESVLLGQERERAARHGMQLLNFPMASILGQSFGADYARNSRAAAEAALNARGIAYIHCYLGLHRAVNVERYLAQFRSSSHYPGSVASARSPDTLLLDQANFAFLDADYAGTLAQLATIQAPGPAALQLAGWANYRLGRIPVAREQFNRALAIDPDDLESQTGLAYCSLRDGDLVGSDKRFTEILSKRPEDPAAIEGLAYARYRQGRADEARTLFSRALALNPANEETRAMLNRLQAASPAVAVPLNATTQ